jgi:hypothetical protein
MTNPNGKFPLQSKERTPLCGINESLIDFYGLQDKVRELRQAGVGVISIAKEVSEKYLIPKGLKGISHGCVTRWCNENIPNNEQYDGRRKPQVNINVYDEYKEMLETTQLLIDTLTAYVQKMDEKTNEVDDITTIAKNVKELTFSIEKQVSRKLVLVDKVFEVQQKVYDMMKAWEYVDKTLQAVKSKDLTIYASIISELQKDPVFVECTKQIEKSKK